MRFRLIGLAALLIAAPPVRAESQRIRDQRSTSSYGTAGGGEFPTWEREVESEERSPLPWGPPGRLSPAWTADLSSAATGVAVADGRFFVVPQADGSISVFTLQGELVLAIRAGGRITLPPVDAGTVVLVAAGERLVGVTSTGIAWSSEPGGRIVFAPAWSGDAAYVVREGGTLERLSLRDGSRGWRVALGAEATAASSVSGAALVVGVGGEVVTLRPETGEETGRLPLGNRVDSLLASETRLYAAGSGRSQRSRDVTPIVASWPLNPRTATASGDPWRLRVGGSCAAPMRLMDDYLVMQCADGYVRAVERAKGVGGWKTDLPSATSAPPVLVGGRMDYVIPQSRHAVALQGDNGAVVGWVSLPDEDETFVGVAAGAGGITASVTSFGRIVGWSWEWLVEEGDVNVREEDYLRPGEDPDNPRERKTIAVPVMR